MASGAVVDVGGSTIVVPLLPSPGTAPSVAPPDSAQHVSVDGVVARRDADVPAVDGGQRVAVAGERAARQGHRRRRPDSALIRVAHRRAAPDRVAAVARPRCKRTPPRGAGAASAESFAAVLLSRSWSRLAVALVARAVVDRPRDRAAAGRRRAAGLRILARGDEQATAVRAPAGNAPAWLRSPARTQRTRSPRCSSP